MKKLSDNEKYIKQREELIEQALRFTFHYCDEIENIENKNIFNRVFLNTMDKMCYDMGISTIKPRRMSHICQQEA